MWDCLITFENIVVLLWGFLLMLKTLLHAMQNSDSHRVIKMLELQRASMFSQSGGEAMVHGNMLSHVSNIPNLASFTIRLTFGMLLATLRLVLDCVLLRLQCYNIYRFWIMFCRVWNGSGLVSKNYLFPSICKSFRAAQTILEFVKSIILQPSSAGQS
jgi:hypothetical protein